MAGAGPFSHGCLREAADRRLHLCLLEQLSAQACCAQPILLLPWPLTPSQGEEKRKRDPPIATTTVRGSS